MVSESGSQTARALIAFSAAKSSTPSGSSSRPFFTRFKYSIGRHVLISPDRKPGGRSSGGGGGAKAQTASNKKTENLESSFRLETKALKAILGHIKWAATNATEVCKISVRHVEASNRHTGGPAVRAKGGGDDDAREVKMRVDLMMSSGIQKSYQLGCFSGMGSIRQAAEMKRLYLGEAGSGGTGAADVGTEMRMPVRLLRSIVVEMIDPRAEDFVMLVRDTSVVLKGITESIHEEGPGAGGLLNWPRTTTVKVPLQQFVRCSAVKGTLVQMSLKPVRVVVDLAASLFLSTAASAAGGSGSGTFESDVTAMPTSADAAASTIDVFVNEQGTFTRFQSHSRGGGGGLQFVFEIASKSHNEDDRNQRKRRAKKQLSRVDDDDDNDTAAAHANAAAEESEREELDHSRRRVLHNMAAEEDAHTSASVTIEHGRGHDHEEDDGDMDLFVPTQTGDDETSPNRSFGKLVGRSSASVNQDYYLSQLEQRHKSGGGSGGGGGSAGAGAGASQFGESGFTEDDATGGGGGHFSRRWAFGADGNLESVGWETRDDGLDEDEAEHEDDGQEEEEEDEDVLELRRSQFQRGFEAGDLNLENEIGPTQQKTVVKGLFD